MIEIIFNNYVERKKLTNLSKDDLYKIIVYQVKNGDNCCILMKRKNYVEFIPLSYKGKGRFKSKSIYDILQILLDSGRKVFIFNNLLEVLFFTNVNDTVYKMLSSNDNKKER